MTQLSAESLLLSLVPGGLAAAGLAKILLADTDLASRLTLKSLLSAAGYTVDGAATASEAIGKLDANEYQLVLADLRTESDDAGARLLSYARQKEFRPATSLISSDMIEEFGGAHSHEGVVRMSQENISYLLAKVADLIGRRADRRTRLSANAGCPVTASSRFGPAAERPESKAWMT